MSIKNNYENILLSIIVPVYNVEKYLRQCCDTILLQKYSNIEVLLIDDGSTDSSGSICDEYAKMDNRVVVFHKKNEGLAATRNFGIQIAKGDYIGFVDSDDWIYEDMYSNMMSVVHKNNAKIVCCNFDLQFDDKIIRRGTDGIDKYIRDEAIVNLFYPDYYQFFAPNKIFNKDLFEGIQFPRGKHFEDIPTIYNLFERIEHVFYIKKSGYVYRQRKESITNISFNPKTTELLDSIDYAFKNSIKKCPNEYKNLIVGYIRYYVSFLDKAIIGKSNNLNYYEKLTSDLIRKNKDAIIQNKKIGVARKIQFIICGYMTKLYEKIAVFKEKCRQR